MISVNTKGDLKKKCWNNERMDGKGQESADREKGDDEEDIQTQSR